MVSLTLKSVFYSLTRLFSQEIQISLIDVFEMVDLKCRFSNLKVNWILNRTHLIVLRYIA